MEREHVCYRRCNLRREKFDLKEAEKILKYKDVTKGIQRMWNVKTKVIPVIIGATGIISKSFIKYVSNIPGKHEVKELQKTAILGTAHTSESTNVKVQ